MAQPDEKGKGEVFNYLGVVTSIILGLGIGRLLTGCARLIQARDFIPFSALYVWWLVLLFPLYVTYWWTFWDFRIQARWTFLSFFFLVSGPIALYLITVLLLPDFNAYEQQVVFKPIEHYTNIRNWFFGLFAMLQVWGILLSPCLKTGFKQSSFLDSYKYAQYMLLAALIVGTLSSPSAKSMLVLDSSILVIFWFVLLYLLSVHRPTLSE